MLERQGVVAGVEGRLVVLLAILGRVVEPLVPAKLLAQVAVEPEVVEEVVALEDGVLLHHPVVLLAHERLDHRGRHVGVIERSSRSPMSWINAQKTYSSSRRRG